MAFTTTVDPPPRWASAKVWRHFLSSIDRLPQDDERVRFARSLAEQRLAELGTPAGAAAGPDRLVARER